MVRHKTKIALLDLTGCSGCEVNLLRLGSDFVDLAQDFEITNWRMLQTDKAVDYDVVFVEGFACNDEQVELLRILKNLRPWCSVFTLDFNLSNYGPANSLFVA